jgi:hypothetical protein
MERKNESTKKTRTSEEKINSMNAKRSNDCMESG